MGNAVATYPDWKAPAEDGRLLVWPDAPQLLDDTLANHERLNAETAPIQNIPLCELRRRQRTWLGMDASTPVLATGHQTELYHPGVWAKLALINAAAPKVAGHAYHFAVDTDSPKHLTLRWPGEAAPITDDPNLLSAEWSGLLDGPTPRHIRALRTAVNHAKSNWSFEPMLDSFLDSLQKLSLEEPKLSRGLTNGQHQLDWSLGLRHDAVVTSPMWMSEGYLVFVCHVLSRAGEFAADYNAALAEYRSFHRIDSTTRPMPDLHVDSAECEVPFWLDDLATGGRARATVMLAKDAWTLAAPGGDRFNFDASADGWESADVLLKFLRRHSLRLSPRALTLTLFLRLAVADQFVHGIGGGRYDQVTDRLSVRHFGIEPPKFSVTTATLYFPDAVGRSRACLPCLMQEGHQLKHRVLGGEKMRMVERIASLPRRSPQRSMAFSEMHHRRSAAVLQDPRVKAWENRLREATQQSADDQSLFDRELFYGIQPRERLERVIQNYRERFV